MAQGCCRTLDPVSCDAGRVSAGYLNLLCLLSALLPCLFTSVKESRGNCLLGSKAWMGCLAAVHRDPLLGFGTGLGWACWEQAAV
jgi:hypothetical protein